MTTTTGRLLAIDPGSKSVAWALFEDAALYRCGLARGATVEALLDDFSEQVLGLVGSPLTIVIERPQVYVSRKTKGDPNDLVLIALVGGMCAGAVMTRTGAAVKLPKPSQWKSGNTPKHVQGKRTLDALHDSELMLYDACMVEVPRSLRHNCLDAVSIGLYAVGRDANRRRTQ